MRMRAQRRGFAARCEAGLCRARSDGPLSFGVLCTSLACMRMRAQRRGFAARCEAGLCPAVSLLNYIGLRPWFGLVALRIVRLHVRAPKARNMTARGKRRAERGASPLDHRPDSKKP